MQTLNSPQLEISSTASVFRIKIQRVRNNVAGFTLIELLVVIAIIGVLIALLIPAIQAAREAAATRKAETNLNILADAAGAYHTEVGEFPAGLQELTDFCAQNPTLCTLDSVLAKGTQNGTNYYVGTANGGIWKAQAEPDCPGIEEAAVDSAVGVGVLRSLDGGNTWFTLHGLCHLANLSVTDQKTASEMCKQLRLADAARTRGDLRSRDRILSDFFANLDGQVHKTLTLKNAALIIWVTIGFFEVEGSVRPSR